MYKIVLLLIVFFLSACKESHEQYKYNGYIDADLTYLSPDFPGRLQEVLVNRGDRVKKGQLLFIVEQNNENYSVAMSQLTTNNLLSQRKELFNNLDYSAKNYQRTLQMRHENAASQQDLDLAKKDMDVLENQIKAIDYQIKNSQVNTNSKQWEVLHKEGHASDFGIIFDTYYTKNEYVPTGQPVLSLITKNRIKVVFFIPETSLSQMKLYSKIKIASDGNDALAVGTVRYISNRAQYTSPLIYSRENRNSLMFRVEASIDHPDLNNLHLGQPITLSMAQ
jgi:HlyD family secretion protein